MSKLLPLEYCKLDRAAQRLECEVQDIIHWGEIGAISICVKDIGSGQLIWSATGPKSQEELAASVRRIYSFGHFIDSELHQSPYSYFCYPIMENDLNPSDINHMDDSEASEALVYFGGFWAVDLAFSGGFSFYTEDEDLIGGDFRIKSITPDKNGFIYSAEVQVPNSYHDIPTKDDLYIIKPDLEKLYNAIHNGGKLDNIYNNTELANKVSEQKQHMNAKQTRLSGSSILASLGFMAELLAKASQKYRHGSQPNAKQIKEAVIELATNTLGDDEAKSLQLSNLNKDISLALKLLTDETKG